MQLIGFKEIAAWQNQITLTSVIFILFFKWNTLNKYWVMSIYDRNNNPIALGIKIVTNYDLTAQFVAIGMPAGDIICQNYVGLWTDIQRFDMGQTTAIIYYEPGEFQSTATQQFKAPDDEIL